MKANEFVKDNGIEKCKRIFDDLTDQGHTGYFYKELKRLVNSHELVEKVGGLENAKTFDRDCMYCISHLTDLDSLKNAIADVESCQ